MTQTPSYFIVCVPPNGKAMMKRVEKPFFNSLAENEIIKEIFLADIPHTITQRFTFNNFNSTTADYYLCLHIILKPE